MLQDSIFASLASWLTPTVLFLFLNLMIATIYITSSFSTHKYSGHPSADHHHLLHRYPSVLQRLKSVNFYTYKSPEPTTLSHEKSNLFDTHLTFQQSPPEIHHQNQIFLSKSPSVLQRLKSINISSYFSNETPAAKSNLFDTRFTSQQSPPEINHQNQIFLQKSAAKSYFSDAHLTFQPSPPEINSQNQTFLQKSPSVLQRLKSINLYSYFTHETPAAETQEQTVKPQKEEPKMAEKQGGGEADETIDEIYSKITGKKTVSRSKSDTKPRGGEMPIRLPEKMRKSATIKSAFGNFKEEEVAEARRPATVAEVDDAEVDAKADDFINKFKQQLKLQRIDSIMRYKDLIRRGSNRS